MIDQNSFEFEIYEIFKDQFANNVVLIEANIVKLQNASTYAAAVDDTFRIFHGIKANSRYFDFENITNMADKAEGVLSALRDEEGPAECSIVEWLMEVKEQLVAWSDEMQRGASSFSQAEPALLQKVCLSESHEKPSAIIKQLSIVYLDAMQARANRLLPILGKVVHSVRHVEKLSDFEMILINERPHICLINMGEKSIEAAALCQKHLPVSAIIAVLDKSDRSTLLKLGIEGVCHTITNPIRGDALKRELLAVTDSHFTSRRYLITNKKIKAFIAALQPLPDSVFQIQQICDDDEMSIKDLIKVIKADPILSGIVLKAANNPIYGLEGMNTIDQAVGIFGKRSVQAIVLGKMVDTVGKVDLGAYHMTETIFSKVAALRLALMVKWYAKVSIAALSVLSSTAILGNIGQLLIAQEIEVLGKRIPFSEELCKRGMQGAEEQFMHTTTACVSSDILSYWQLDQDIVDSVRFSDHPKHAPPDIYDLCVANHIVYRLIELDGTIHATLPKSLEMLLNESGLSTEPLQKALDAVMEINNKL